MRDEPGRTTGASGRDTPPRPLAALAGLLDGETPSSRRFLGGLVIGAIAGAALTGISALRGRSRGARR